MFDIRALDNTAWLLEPTWIKRAALRLQQIPGCPTARDVAAEHKRRMEATKLAASHAVRGVKGKVGVIPVYGLIQQRYSAELEKLGGTSVEEISAMFDVLLADKSVDAIVFDVDSPGGSSFGIEEISDKIYVARDRKKLYSIANSTSASAAYWIATAAKFMAATPGADVGSVGVYAIHIDESRALEAEGLTVTMVSAGEYKTELSPYTPLSGEARDNVQFQVDVTYNKFLNALKRNRNTGIENVRNNFGQGRLLNADQAKAAGMIDRIMTFDELVGKLMSGGDTSAGKRVDDTSMRVPIETLRMRQAQRKRSLVR